MIALPAGSDRNVVHQPRGFLEPRAGQGSQLLWLRIAGVSAQSTLQRWLAGRVATLDGQPHDVGRVQTDSIAIW